jgi:outer membrane lipoprotein carrier protein
MACAGILVFAFSQPQMAAEKKNELQPVRLMERRYRAAKTLQATFLERYTESGRVVRAESGTAYFRRPGKMRWEYAAPERNLFLIDGKTAWFYVPGDHTVTRVPAKQSGDWRTPLALLAGEMKVSRVCARVEPAPNERPESAGNAVFTCVVRGPEAAKNPEAQRLQADSAEEEDSVLLEIGRDTGELARIVVRDKGGIGVEFRFAQWRDDPPIAEALFHFEVPPGVAIVNGELPTGAATSQ